MTGGSGLNGQQAAACKPRSRLFHVLAALTWGAGAALALLLGHGLQQGLLLSGSPLSGRIQELALIAFAGACLAYLPARMLLALLPARWRASQRFAAAFVMFGVVTAGMTALLFGLQFRLYFSRWHDDHLSVRFAFETVFTILSACYQFLVLGLRLYIPFGLAGLMLVSLAFARRRI